MNWNLTYRRLQALVGKRLRSITGKTDITLLDINPENYVVKVSSGKSVKRKTQELRTLVTGLAQDQPVHVDSALFGSRSSRSHPETLLANLPDVEWLRIRRRKHILWARKDTHQTGKLRENNTK
jgi:hypothetical protein